MTPVLATTAAENDGFDMNDIDEATSPQQRVLVVSLTPDQPPGSCHGLKRAAADSGKTSVHATLLAFTHDTSDLGISAGEDWDRAYVIRRSPWHWADGTRLGRDAALSIQQIETTSPFDLIAVPRAPSGSAAFVAAIRIGYELQRSVMSSVIAIDAVERVIDIAPERRPFERVPYQQPCIAAITTDFASATGGSPRVGNTIDLRTSSTIEVA